MGENLKRLPGESIKQWRDRIKAQKREQKIQEEIDRGELLDASIVVAPRFEATVSQGTDDKKSRKNNHRVGQESVFGEREFHQNRSLAERAFNDLTDAVGLTSPPTYQDGYGRTLNAEVPLQESAQGQELKRMWQTTKDIGKIAATGFAFGNPITASETLSPIIATSQAYWTANAINDGAQRIGNIGEGVQNFVEDPSLQNTWNVVREVPMLALDVMASTPVVKAFVEAGKRTMPIATTAAQRIAQAFNHKTTPSKYGNLQFIRNLDGVPEVVDGNVQFVSRNNLFTNFTSDLPFRTHSSYKNIPGVDYLVVSPEAFSGIKPVSIEPMDTFFLTSDLHIPPSKVTFISGNPDHLALAKSRGFNTLSNWKLKRLYSKSLSQERPSWKKYREAVDDLFTTKIGRPTYEDYLTLENTTGLNAGVSGEVRKNITTMQNGWANTPDETFTYPNGRTRLFKDVRRAVRGQDPYSWYKNVFYDPSTPAESNFFIKVLNAEEGHLPYSDDFHNGVLNWFTTNNVQPISGTAKGFQALFKRGGYGVFGGSKYFNGKPIFVKNMQNGIGSGLYHLDYGDGKGAFHSGAYVKDGYLYPGKTNADGQLNYIWFNESKPYSIGQNNKPFSRAIIFDEQDVPGVLRVREQNYPIGQWNGKSGFVTNHEMVTPNPVNMDGATVYRRIPIFNTWLRTK